MVVCTKGGNETILIKGNECPVITKDINKMAHPRSPMTIHLINLVGKVLCNVTIQFIIKMIHIYDFGSNRTKL